MEIAVFLILCCIAILVSAAVWTKKYVRFVHYKQVYSVFLYSVISVVVILLVSIGSIVYTMILNDSYKLFYSRFYEGNHQKQVIIAPAEIKNDLTIKRAEYVNIRLGQN